MMYFGQIAYELEIVEERHILRNVRQSTTSAMNMHSARHMSYCTCDRGPIFEKMTVK